jgi:hypothetical protein
MRPLEVLKKNSSLEFCEMSGTLIHIRYKTPNKIEKSDIHINKLIGDHFEIYYNSFYSNPKYGRVFEFAGNLKNLIKYIKEVIEPSLKEFES